MLRRLPNLGSFFSGNVVIRFPKLKKLSVRQCPVMKTFSHGDVISNEMLNTDYLMNRAKAVREHWDDDDVNITVRQHQEDDSNWALQHLFTEKVCS